MRPKGLIIGKWKMRRIMCLEISWLDSGLASGPEAFSAMFADEDEGLMTARAFMGTNPRSAAQLRVIECIGECIGLWLLATFDVVAHA